MFFVIGSGPAAMAVTYALVTQGREVTILDVGTSIGPEQETIVHRMSQQEPEEWNAVDLAAINGDRISSAEAIHSKTAYGSAYSFDPRENAMGIRWKNGQGFNHSLALGGLSNVWGSALLPYRQADMTDWPIKLGDLEAHYRAVMDFVPGTRVDDDLENILPAYSNQQNLLKPSLQGWKLLHDLGKNREPLRKAGMIFGRSRLAIRAMGDTDHRDCAHCTLCLSGCPYGLIYSSAQTLSDLLKTGRVRYFADHLVEKLEPTRDGVDILGINLSDGAAFRISAERVFLGAGVLPTAKIILNSLNRYDTHVKLLDSQYFIYPLLAGRSAGDVENERMHTASQAFIEIDDPTISDHLVHLQIYGYSSFLKRELNRTFLRWPLKSPSFRHQFLGRLLVAQGFMHSNDSGSVDLVLQKGVDGKPYLSVRRVRSRHAFLTAFKIGLKLLHHTRHLNALPLLPGLQFPDPGSGYHSGGTFPMRHQPGIHETDMMGRLPGLRGVHLVDASIFPSIPATSITMSIMANAHRIGISTAGC